MCALVVAALLARGDFAMAVTLPTEVSFSSVSGPAVTILGRLFNSGDVTNKPAVIMLHGCAGIYSGTCWQYDNTSCYSKVATTTNCDTNCCWTSDQKRASKVGSIYLEWGDRLVANGYVVLLVDSFNSKKRRIPVHDQVCIKHGWDRRIRNL